MPSEMTLLLIFLILAMVVAILGILFLKVGTYLITWIAGKILSFKKKLEEKGK